MKKLAVLVMFLMGLILLVGCGTTATDEVYDKETETVEKATDEEQVEEDPVEETAEDAGREDVEQIDEEPVETDESAEEEVAPETPSDDAYPVASEPIDFDYSEFEGTEPTVITDDAVIADLGDYLYHFYFNYYFVHGLEEETGNVGIDAMTLFALSYIMQYEYNELEFDAETFTLYIPEEYVIQKVEKVFLRQLDMFKAYEDLGIGYEDELYSVNVEDGIWDVDMVVNKVEKLGDFTFRVTADIISKTSGRVKEQVLAIVDESLNGHVLVNYSVETVED